MKKLIVFFLLLSLKGFSQDPRLFEHIWYLHDLVIDGVSNIPPINSETPYVDADFYESGELSTGVCGEEYGSGRLEYIGTNEFLVLEMNFLAGVCYYLDNREYSSLYQSFWVWSEVAIPYQIIEDGQIRTLIITNSNDDYAVFGNERPLSMVDFSSSNFLIYPNPVKEVLQITSTSNQLITAKIYDINGKLLQSHSLEIGLSAIDVKALNQGLYFVVFKSKTGERVSKKFVKQ